ncbi:MAG: enoyl-CoA hydratase/isomerase family protein [Candidatus Paracaedimonas acanthamoebae]|uniref:Enoyl-CoA hydratase/isomerase family protein n=1 Tax=Candidatus Paracaedimonas acanthamoebae TaxID=244581 RepID=A0A8J7PW75_9PROT|nr:enoyl-CoA hydratase/isomerase family protein [Candidatus Paracaedimonas acanthamoebae]
MTFEIKKVGVIGAGTMGSGIAAHLANAGVEVLLLDMPQSGFGKKNQLAEQAIERLQKVDPAAFMTPKMAKFITPGNLEDDLEKLSACDWIIEAIVENLDAKQNLYQKLEGILKPHTIISSNTSTILLRHLIKDRTKIFQSSFMITHFFNPPRYMRLLEVIKSSFTDPKKVEAIKLFTDIKLGKSVVDCHDSPGFIGNRIGIFWLQLAVLEAIQQGLKVEEVDALFSKPMGIPKTGVFGLIDLVGLDLMPLIGTSMKASLPSHDLYCQLEQETPLIQKMISEGYVGRKGKGGFYRINRDNGSKTKEVIDLITGTYSQTNKVKLSILENTSTLKDLLSYPDQYGKYVWSVLSQLLCYVASKVDEIADDIVAIDTAMKLGYGWKYGPFELLDKIGTSWFVQRLKEEGRAVPSLLEKVGSHSFYKVQDGKLHHLILKGGYQEIQRLPGQLLLSDIKITSKPLAKNGSAALWDIGDGVVCLEFTSKMNSIDLDIMKMIHKAVEIVQKDYKALVIYNEGQNFSVGANLGLALFAVNCALWPLIQQLVAEGQQAYKALKYAPFPVVGAPSGMALGGGCEILLHCDAIQAHAETYMGLVEVGVGLVPAWGGCKEMLGRWLNHHKRPGGAMVAVGKVFEMIGTATVAKSAFEAKELLFIKEENEITMNRDRLLAAAKQKALDLVKDYHPPQAHLYSLPGGVARVALSMAVKVLVKAGKATPYDEEVSKYLATILSGGDIDITDTQGEDEILKLEREAFITLIKNPKTLARIEHILATGKPLRN